MPNIGLINPAMKGASPIPKKWNAVEYEIARASMPFGACTRSSAKIAVGIAAEVNPKAMRAVGAAVGANPISFVVPCHRALGKSGALTGYHWGLTRKRAMLGWESAHA